MGAKELFAELAECEGVISPTDLTGADLETWNAFVREARLGKWAHVSQVRMFEVLKKHTPLNCSLSAFRWHLHRELQEPADGKTQSLPKPRRRAAG